VYLFGKVQDQGAWRSCCVVVEGCHYSLLVVRAGAGVPCRSSLLSPAAAHGPAWSCAAATL
jgi:hypothetical protein